MHRKYCRIQRAGDCQECASAGLDFSLPATEVEEPVAVSVLINAVCVWQISVVERAYTNDPMFSFFGDYKKKHLAFHILCLLPLLQDQCLLLVI